MVKISGKWYYIVRGIVASTNSKISEILNTITITTNYDELYGVLDVSLQNAFEMAGLDGSAS